MIHKIYPDFDLETEEKFAQAHIALFVAAVLYAIHMVLIAFISFKISRKWARTEKMELDHYFEVRHAFESVKEELQIDKFFEPEDITLVVKAKMYITSPRKAHRYNKLLQQIRFHELRSYFISANNLPKDFQLSHYLEEVRACKSRSDGETQRHKP